MLNKAIKWSALFTVTAFVVAALNYLINGDVIGDGLAVWIDEGFTSGFLFWAVITSVLAIVWVIRALARTGDGLIFASIYLSLSSVFEN